MNKNYTFSSRTVAEFYGRRFYAILKGSEVVAYSEKKFDIPEDVIFYGGRNTIIFEKAVIRGGEIWGGVIWGGVIRGGEIRGGVIRGGVIRGGVIRGGVIRGGEIWGGVIRGGVIRGGEIWGGVIWGGVIRGGEIWGGEIWGGEIRGGEIWGGEIWGGVIRGGEIRGGVYKISMLQIQGTRHFCYARYSERGDKIELGIGCIVKPLNEWIECYENIGVKESYSKEEISEYGMYIRLFAQRYEPELLT